jgi:hypothetical protein
VVAGNANEVVVVPTGGVAKSMCESGGRVCVGAFGRNLASVAMQTFPRLIYIKINITASVF